ncbi:MAG: hypothetical protein RL264_1568, partial [Bacteroidota bacterium]|jgi:hypothetical protein
LFDFGQGLSPNNQFTTSVSGAYSVTVIDNNGCSVTESNLMINPMETTTLTSNVVDVVCNSLGSIELFASNPNLVSEINWDNYQYGWTNTDLSPGVYNATILLRNGCTMPFSATVNDASYSVQFTGSITQPSCNYTNDGTIEVQVARGVPPFSYNGLTNNIISPIGAGSYVVTVIDQNGCQGTETYIIANPAPFFALVNKVNPSCFNSCDGVLTATPFGAQSIPVIQWSNNVTSLVNSNLCAGTYSLHLVSDRGCVFDTTVSLNQPQVIQIQTIQLQNNSCFGESNGKIEVAATNGVAPFTYSWSPSGNGNLINNLSNGQYNLTVTDANGCTSSQTYTITSPSQLQLSFTGSLFVCNGSTTTLTVSGTGGTPPYLGTGNTSLSAGTYTLSIKDANGCFVSQPVTIMNADPIKIDISKINPCKETFNGSINLNLLSGAQPFTYQWSNGFTTQNIAGIGAGVYTVTITDANGCTRIETVNLNSSSGPSVTASVTNVVCQPANNGSIVLTVNGIVNNPNVSYFWTHGPTTSTISGLSAGTYSVKVVEPNGCVTEMQFLVKDDCGCPPNFSVDICGPTVVCEGERFSLTSNVFPRPQGYNYTYSWTTPLGTYTSANYNNGGAALSATGWYTLTVNYPPNCSVTAQVYVTVRPRPAVTITNSVTGNASSYRHLRGCDIDLTASGAAFYTWTLNNLPYNNNGNLLNYPTIATDNTGTIADPQTLTFRVTGVDSMGCSRAAIQTITLLNPVVTVSLSNGNIFNPNSNRTLTMGQSQLFANATYNWSTIGWSSNLRNTSRTAPIATLAGNYMLKVTQNGCTRYYAFEVTKQGLTVVREVFKNVSLQQNVESQGLTPSNTEIKRDEFKIRAYPIPANNELTIDIQNKQQEYITLTVIDFTGRSVFELNVGAEENIQIPIDVSGLARGQYFIDCYRNGEKRNKSIHFIKN